MTKLHRIGGSTKDTTCDVVFIHGIKGDATTSWCHNTKNRDDSWPHWLAADSPQAAIWALEYEASPSTWFGKKSSAIPHVATDALTELENKGVGKQPLVLVCHSMGGIVAKQILRNATDYGEPSWHEIAANIRDFIFLATPHSGANIATWIANIFDASVSVETLRRHDANLEDLNRWFRQQMIERGFAPLCFYEKRDTLGVRVVSQDSADVGCGGPPRGIDADHSEIVKPRSRDETVYQSVLLRLRRFIDDHVNSASSTTNQSGVLKYISSVEIDPSSFADLMARPQDCDIHYSPQINDVLALIDTQADDVDGFLQRSPKFRETVDPDTRGEHAASVQASFHEVRKKAEVVRDGNRQGLRVLLERLRNDKVDPDLAAQAVKSFGTFAALSLIREIKRTYDYNDDGSNKYFFAGYRFHPYGTHSYFRRAPHGSATGRRVFGYQYYVTALVGQRDLETAMMPLDIARRLAESRTKGDNETFYTWILPQLLLFRCDYGLDNFPRSSWEVDKIRGDDVEWVVGATRDPWKDLSG